MFLSTRNQIALFLGLFFAVICIGYYIFWKSNAIENQSIIEGMKDDKILLLEKTIKFKSKNLLTYSYDYTYWDEMVAFINEKDTKWGDENISASMPTYEVDYVWIYKPDRSHLCTYAGEAKPHITQLPFDDETLKQIIESGKTQHFFVVAGNNLIEISGASVHPSYDKERKTTELGYFFAGRIWSDDYLEEIGQFTESTIKLTYPVDTIFPELKKTGKFQFFCTTLLLGFDSKPVARVESFINFEIAEIFATKSDNRILLVALLLLFSMTIFFAFFGLKVYKPLDILSKSLSNEDPKILGKLLMKKDEFGKLSTMINDFFKQKEKLIQEIDERIQVEKLLIKLSQAIEQSPATIIITGIEGDIEYVNPKFTQVTGYKLDEVIGKNPRFLKSGNKTKTEYRRMWDTIREGNVWKGEFSNKKKNGEIYFESVIISPIFDETGKITNYLAVNEDISEKKREDSIRNIIFEIARAGSVSKNLKELIEHIRIHLSEIIDVTNFYVAIYDEKSDTFTLPHFQDQKDNITSFKAGKTLTAYVLRSKRSFLGTVHEIDELKNKGIVESLGESAKVWLGVPLLVDNRAMGVFSLQSYDNEKAFDLKDKEMLEFISHEISHTIQRMKSEAEIVTALERAEQSDKLKSAFLANISHEIRTPLNSILGFTRLMNDDEIDAVKKHRFSRIIKSNGNQLLSIINGLLDFSLIESGQIKLLKKSFILENILVEVQNEFLSTAHDKGVDIILSPEIHHSKTIIENDLSRLRQVIGNIVGNAVKFTHSGSVSMHVKQRDKLIQIRVSDTGIGIPVEFWPHIFERFQQAEKSNVRKFGGNGLGLAISKHIVELMGGEIRFESEVGVGSTFYIEIPLVMSTPEIYLIDRKVKNID
jgi:PAS domain S-box-containing protein